MAPDLSIAWASWRVNSDFAAPCSLPIRVSFHLDTSKRLWRRYDWLESTCFGFTILKQTLILE